MELAGQTRTYYELHVEGTAREVYTVMAKDEEHARQLFANGTVTKPVVSEVVRGVERSLDDQ